MCERWRLTEHLSSLLQKMKTPCMYSAPSIFVLSLCYTVRRYTWGVPIFFFRDGKVAQGSYRADGTAYNLFEQGLLLSLLWGILMCKGSTKKMVLIEERKMLVV